MLPPLLYAYKTLVLARTLTTDGPAAGARQLRDRLVSRQDRSRFDTILSSALRSHFSYALEEEAVTYSPLLVGASERVGAAPDRALALRRTRQADMRLELERGLKGFEREVRVVVSRLL